MQALIKQLHKTAKTYPTHRAMVVDSEWSITYAQLINEINLLVQKLEITGIKPGCLVAIHLEKSTQYVISVLAVWTLGAAFVPLDPSLPASRKKHMLAECKPNVIIQQDDLLELQHDDVLYSTELAYVLYTSGSTGRPKGVMVPYAGLLNLFLQQIAAFQINSQHRNLLYLSIQFDASLSDIGTTLLAGACLCLVSGDQLAVASQLPTLINENRITHIDLPPSLLAVLNPDNMPDCLETIIIGGEVCPISVVQRWAKKYSLINVYGPTETTICSSMQRCHGNWAEPLIGHPIAQMNYLVLDEHGKESCIGELHISGIGLALGYVANPTLSEEKFVFINHIRHYRTGDRVKTMPDGNLIYLNRIDRQFKIRGQLVAPEEIEAFINQHPLVRASAVFCKETAQRKQLVAMVEGTSLSSEMLYYHLQTQLPTWMIPQCIVLTNQLPKNRHGKIDYLLLSQMDLPSKPVLISHTAALSDSEQNMQKLWQEVLELPSPPTINDDLFDTLGASSLDVLQLIVRAESYGYFFSIELLYHLRTIHSLALWLNSNSLSSTDAKSTVLLKQEIGECHYPVDLPIHPNHSILITGATGFLGIHLLAELLADQAADITCLVRAKTIEEAFIKLRQVADQHQLSIANQLDRLTIVLGDLSLPQFGLSNLAWQQLCQHISNIYHVAAEVNQLKSFAALKAINLDGVKEIARLAASITQKHIYYVSTLSVFVATDQNHGPCQEDDTLENTQWVYGGYAQTKWAADYFLQHSGLAVTIFRLGLITGDSVQGISSSHDYLQRFIQGLLDLGRIPAGNWDQIHLDATPVDFAAKAIAHLAKGTMAKCYHVVNHSTFSLQMIVDALKKYGHELQMVSCTDWQTLPLTNDNMAAASLALCRLFSDNDTFNRHRSMDLFQATDVIFDRRHTENGLKNTGIVCPAADAHLLDLYLKRIIHG